MGAHGEFFARAVKDRRKQLNLSMQRVYNELNGPSIGTQVEAEAGRLGENTHTGTFEKYDAVLQWVPGSASTAFTEGREPIRLEDQRELETGPTERTVGLEQLLPLLDAHRALHEARTAELPAALKQLDLAVTNLIGPFVTDLLERNRGATPSPWMEIAFGEALSVPVSPEDPNADERLYRRYLLGRTDGMDEADRERYERRFQSRQSGSS
ncbi:hypothetical protein [Nocardia yamanashiensis]|uniref:hypothetical protein n=1 Tax=Nocardia yamanashiensis TaxID=209247 RepID=UPI000AEE2D93|nr:hypothetical protein [Nocardia yamanashiensis]